MVMKNSTLDSYVINELHRHRSKLTRQQFNTLKGQVKAGCHIGALNGLRKILGRVKNE